MIKNIIFVPILFVSFSSMAQTFTSHSNGNWTAILLAVWDQALFPTALNNVVVSWDDTVTVNISGACDDMTVEGTLIVENGYAFTVNGDLDLDGGHIELTSGTLTIDGDAIINGSIENNGSSSNFIEITGDIENGGIGSNKIQTVDGGIIIYGGIELPSEVIVFE